MLYLHISKYVVILCFNDNNKNKRSPSPQVSMTDNRQNPAGDAKAIVGPDNEMPALFDNVDSIKEPSNSQR